jgi:protein-tyrosine phosphatase
MTRTPVDSSYWVKEHTLLAGEYPGSACRERAGAKVMALLDHGVEVFVDLTEEGELESYADLVQPGAHLRFPIRDLSVPETLDEMVTILDTIDEHIRAGRLVYVHCRGGVGRTGVVVGCWLARRLGGPAALSRLGELWSRCPTSRSRRSPETDEQRQFIRGWERGR